MAQETILPKGLYTNVNASNAPAGTMSEASNCVSPNVGVVAGRGGLTAQQQIYYDYLGNRIPFPMKRMFETQGHLFGIFNVNSYGTGDCLTELDGGSIDIYDISSAEAQNNLWHSWEGVDSYLYVTGDDYVRRFSVSNLTLNSKAGVSQAPLIYTVSRIGTAPTWLTANNYVAYRVTFGYYDANGKEYEGAPCGRFVFQNTGANGSVQLSTLIPDQAIAGWFCRVYRTFQTTATEPGENFFLSSEISITSAQITAGTIVYNDLIPDENLSLPLYTSANQEGISQENFPPPQAGDIAVHKNCMIYANAIGQQTFSLVIGDLSGLANDTYGIDFNGNTYNKSNTNNTGSTPKKFDGTNPARTAENFAYTFNKVETEYYAVVNSANGIDAVTIFSNNPQSTQFDIVADSQIGDLCVPNITTAVMSKGLGGVATVYWSKPQQYEAVPLANFNLVGNPTTAIDRVIPYRDSLWVFKNDGEVYKIIGDNFAETSVIRWATNIFLTGYDAIINYDEALWCITTSGIVRITDSGVDAIGEPIHNLVQEKLPMPSTGISTDYVVSVDITNRRVLFSNGLDTVFVYNMEASNWTTWDGQFTSFFTRSMSTYAGEFWGGWKPSATGLDTFWVLAKYDETVFVDQGYDNDSPFTVTDIPVLKRMQFNRHTSGGMLTMKRYREMAMQFDALDNPFDVTFYSNFSQTPQTESDVQYLNTGNAYGAGAYGAGAYGYGVSGNADESIRIYVPLQKQRALWIVPAIQTESDKAFILVGYSLEGEAYSNRFVRKGTS